MCSLKTIVIRVDAKNPEDTLLKPAAEALKKGELVAFPTETVYGLGANALKPDAVASIFRVKGRPADNPLIVHVADPAGLEPLVSEVTPLARKLLAFMPGPLTLVLRRSKQVPDLVTAGLDTVAVRMPDHPVARRLIELSGVPVAAPSANRSGRPSPTQAWHVLQDLDGRIPYLVDGGPCQYGLESTVVDVTGPKPVILRPGSITAAMILSVTGVSPVLQDTADADVPRAPGMKYRHYAPKARVAIVDESTGPAIAAKIRGLISNGKRIGVFACERLIREMGLSCIPVDAHTEKATVPADGACFSLVYGPEPDAEKAGQALFDALRILDSLGCDLIIAEGLPAEGIGSAYMNRLRKAACLDEKTL